MSHQQNCALRVLPHPLEIIKERPNAYCYKSDKGKYVFRYEGKRSDIPKFAKYGQSLEEVIKYRDEFFENYNAVA